MAIEIWDGQWRNSSDPEIYTNTGWKDIMEGHAYIGNSVWNRFFIRITPVAPTLGNFSRTNSSLTFSYSHPGDSSGVYLVLKLVRVSDNAVIAGPENTSLTSGAISGNKTYTGLAQGVSYRFEGYAVYNSYSINSTVATTTYSTLNFSPVTPTLSLNNSTVSSITVRAQLTTSSSPYNARIVIWNDDTQSATQASRLPANGQVGTIDVLFSSSSLSVNTSYRFAAYTEYRDPSTLEVIANSSIVYQQFSTLAYLVTTPTQPYNTDRQQFSLKFKASSNANYSRNGSSYTANAYIEFNLYRTSDNQYVSTRNATLPNNDLLTELEVEFTGLTSGVSYYCRARTYYYSPVSQYSADSVSSTSVTTVQLTTVSTGLISASNTTYIQTRLTGASSEATGFPVANHSDGSQGSKWYSNGTYFGTSDSVSVKQIYRDGKVVRYSGPLAFPAPTFTTASTLTVEAPIGISALMFSSQHTTRQTPTGRVADLEGGPVGTTFCFSPGTPVRVDGPGPPPSAAAFMPGNRTVLANNGPYITVPVVGPTPIVTGQPWPGTIYGDRPGLTISGAPVYSYNTPAAGGVLVEVPAPSVPPTPTFSLINVRDPTPVTMKITGQRKKSSTIPFNGTQFPEEATIYFVVKSQYSNPRMVSGSNTIKVTIPRSEFTSNVSLTCKTSTSAGNTGNNLANQGSATIASGSDSHTFNLQQTVYPYFDTFFNAYTFAIIIGGNRVFNTALDAPGLAINEIEFSFTYDTYL